jgi:hypothetical protein
VPDLPHTRSGKIMRRLLRARELGLPIGDLSTLESADGGNGSGDHASREAGPPHAPPAANDSREHVGDA